MTGFTCICGQQFEPTREPWPDAPIVAMDMRLSYCPTCLPAKIEARDRMYAEAAIVRAMECEMEGHIRSIYSQCLRCGAPTKPYYYGWPGWPSDEDENVSG